MIYSNSRSKICKL